MIWIIGIIAAFIIFVAYSFYKRYLEKEKRLAEIKEKWGQPYYKERDVKLLEAYLVADNSDEHISTITADDLDLESLFAYVDRTNSRPGQQYLYKKLHCPQLDAAALLKLDNDVAMLAKDRPKQEEIELELSKLDTKNAGYLPELFIKEQLPLFNAMQTGYIQIAGIIMLGLVTLLIVAPNGLLIISLLMFTMINLALHYSNKGKIAQYTHSLPQLLVLNKVGWWLMKNVEINNTEAVRNSLNKINKLKRLLWFVSFQNSISGEPTDIMATILELIKTIFLLEPLMFIASLRRVNKYRADIEIVYKYVAEIDMLIAISSVREGLPYYCKPTLTGSDNELRLTGLYHPLVEDCVANSMFSTAEKGVLITGSNMSGKTTFIRAIAINALLAQTIYTCCASEYNAPLLNIRTSIRISDDVEEHKSYFQAEALSVLDILNRSNINEPCRSLVIIDEIFRGTNTIERIAAAKSVLSYLTANRNFVFVSTHDLELAELLGDDYAIYSFEESVADKRLVFDYKIKEGLLKNKNGLAILESIGYPASVVKDALNVSEELRIKYQI